MKTKTKILFLILFFGFFGLAKSSWAANIYVDQTLSSNCTSGNYSTANRNCSGSEGNAYQTIQSAINAMESKGDKIYMRGGIYQPTSAVTECVRIPLSKKGTAWTEGNYNSLSSYPGEWAIIDGQNNCGTGGIGLGFYDSDFTRSTDLAYWKFERFEIKNMARADGQGVRGIHVNGGPFQFRYLYIHDNLAETGDNNPCGIGGYHWQDSIVEYNYFKDNGVTPVSGDTNPAHICVFSDYNWTAIGNNGFNPANTENVPLWKNEIRYNYFTGGNVGIKHKGSQLYTGRTEGSPFVDTYSDYGDKWHHNIMQNLNAIAYECNQDFCQIYNNIADNCGSGIRMYYENSGSLYKSVAYNNTLMNGTQAGLLRMAYTYYQHVNPLVDYYGYDYNNIVDNTTHYESYCQYLDFAICDALGGPFNLNNYFSANNYAYRPQGNDLYTLNRNGYTQAEFENQNLTHTPRQIFTNSYNAGNLLYQGTSGAQKYITRVEHIIEGSTTIANGGVGYSHPYLSDVSIPAYIGATNPSDNDWVAGVLSLGTISNLQNSSGDPDWIEGASPDTTPPSAPTGLMIN